MNNFPAASQKHFLFLFLQLPFMVELVKNKAANCVYESFKFKGDFTKRH